MKKSKLLIITILTVLLLGLKSWPTGLNAISENNSNIEENSKAAGNHAPIYIIGNESLATFIEDEGLSGNGTFVSPYIIENFTIEASTAHGIEIRSTDAYLIIQNCTVENGSSNYKDGIHLYNATNVNISNNLLSNNYDGISLDSSSNNNTLSGNTANNNRYGIRLWESCNNTLSGNTANNNDYGIQLWRSSSNNTLSGNTASYNNDLGIHLDSPSNNNILTGNTANNNDLGIYLAESSNNTLSGNTASYNNYYGIGLWESSNNTLSGNTANNNDYGIRTNSSSNNILSGNTIYNCANTGIYLDVFHNSTLLSNTVYNCSTGIRVLGTSNNTISYNIVYNNTNYGLTIDGSSYNNTVTWNSFVNNSLGFPSQAFDDGTMNNISSNYWSDWSGTGNYSIDGTANNNDTSPLLNPVLPTVTVLTPIAQEYDIDTITVMLSGTPTVLLYQYYLAGFDGTNHTWTSSVDRTLPDGPYTLHAYGSDILGNTAHEEVSFTIDAYLPTIVIDSPTAKSYPTGTIAVTLSGDNAEHYWYYIVGFDSINQTWSSTVLLSLDESNYVLHAYSNDSTGNEAHTSVIFTVDTTPPAVDITSPDNTTYSYTSVPLAYTVLDGPFTTTLYLNGMANTTAVPTGSVVSDFPDAPTIPDGSYNITFVAVDQAGNIGKDMIFFTIDTKPPTVIIVFDINTYTTGNLKVDLSGDADHYWYYIDGVDMVNQTWTELVSLSLADGTYTLHAYGNDSVGNIEHTSFTFTLGITNTTATTTPTTTTQETTPEITTTTITTKTTSEPTLSSFPGVLTVLMCFGTIVVFAQRHKKA